MNKIKNFIGKLHLEEIVYFFKEKDKYLKYRKDLEVFKNELPKPLYTNPIKNKNVLIVSLISGFFTAGVKEEALIAKSLEIDGANIYVLLERSSLAEGFYKALGINNFIYLDDFYFKYIDNKEIFEYSTLEELMELKYKEISIGKHVTSVFMRRNYSGYFKVNEEIKQKLDVLLNDSLTYIKSIEDIQNKFSFEKAVFLERGYSPNGELFDYLISQNIECIQWCGSHKENAITLKRYSKNNSDKHPASVSDKTWKWAKETIEVNEIIEKEVYNELYKNYSDGTWFSEVGTQFNTKITEKNDLIEKLDIDESKPIAVIFSHLFWDATFFFGVDLFYDYKVWFIETIKAACKNDNVNWYIKVHPANLVKLSRDGYTGELAEVLAIKEEIGELPSHIKIIYPDTDISTFSLFSLMDFCITVRGTIGIESTSFGITTLTAGTGRYDSLGFTNDSQTKKEYIDKVLKIQTLKKMTESEKELAVLYAYVILRLRPFNLKSFSIEYEKNDNASAVVDLKFENKVLSKNYDMKELSNWIMCSSEEDYIFRKNRA